MTKRMAGMQPYFFPYLGYWQLIDAVDSFVLFDEAQYIKQGWINRNRVLKQGGGWQYIQVPVAKHPMNTLIRDVRIAPGDDWRPRVLNKLSHYRSIAPYFEETIELVRQCLSIGSQESIGALNASVVRSVCKALSIRSEIIVSSEHGFDYTDVATPGDWALAHALQLGAIEIVNPLNGIFLQNITKLTAHGISLSALHPPTEIYAQGAGPHEPQLSIIDVMMFNGLERTRELVARPTLTRCAPSAPRSSCS